MPEKFFYMFLIFLILSILGYISAAAQDLEDSRPGVYLKNFVNACWFGMIISAICWVWS